MTDQTVPTYNPSSAVFPGLSKTPPSKDPATSFGEAPSIGGTAFYPQPQEIDVDINLSSRLTGVTPVHTATHQYDVPDVKARETNLADAVLDEPDEWAPPPRPKEIGIEPI